MVNRCRWVPTNNKLYCDYHDKEWGKSIGDDQKLFELLCLESYQSGLSWLTVLNKRQAFNRVFHNYDIERVAQFSLSELEEALQNPDIIRHKLKLEATVNNAKQVLKLQDEFGSLSHYFWHFFDGKPLINNVPTYKDVPSSTALSQQIANNLKKRGFKFLGPTTIYSFLQAAGFVNDHENNCDFK